MTWTGGRGSISHEGEVLSFLPLVDALDSAGAGAQRPRAGPCWCSTRAPAAGPRWAWTSCSASPAG
ncbi:hypothetical protein ACN28S_41075 [Cystobacter fuscus]